MLVPSADQNNALAETFLDYQSCPLPGITPYITVTWFKGQRPNNVMIDSRDQVTKNEENAVNSADMAKRNQAKGVHDREIGQGQPGTYRNQGTFGFIGRD